MGFSLHGGSPSTLFSFGWHSWHRGALFWGLSAFGLGWFLGRLRGPERRMLRVMMERRMALVRVKGKYQVTIPKEVRRKLGLRVGDYLEVEVQGSAIVLKPKALVDKDEAFERLRSLLERLREKRAALSEEEVEREVLEAIWAVRAEGTAG